MKNIKLPESLGRIGNNAFANCNSLESVIIPEKVWGVGEMVFSRCGNLRNIYCRVKKPLLSLPKGWDKNWAGTSCKVTWNYKG